MNNVRWEPVRDDYIAKPDEEVRLCRAVPAQWSQEPPTEPGWWWHWSQYRGVELLLLEPPLGEQNTWNATDPEDGMAFIIGRTHQVPGHYWLPARVPAPPVT